MKYFCLKSKSSGYYAKDVNEWDGSGIYLQWVKMWDCQKFEYSRKGEVQIKRFQKELGEEYPEEVGQTEVCVCEIECKEIDEKEQKQPKDVFIILYKETNSVMAVVDNLHKCHAPYQPILDWYADVYGFERNDIYGFWTKSIDGSKCPLIDGSIPRFE